jgi:hypothetical protein
MKSGGLGGAMKRGRPLHRFEGILISGHPDCEHGMIERRVSLWPRRKLGKFPIVSAGKCASSKLFLLHLPFLSSHRL